MTGSGKKELKANKKTSFSVGAEKDGGNIHRIVHGNALNTNIISENQKKSTAFGKFNKTNIVNTNINIFERAKEELDMAYAAEYYGLSFNQAGFSNCPFHDEKTPSFRVYKDTNSFYCFGCGQGGNVIDFTMKLFDLDPLEAVKKLNIDFRLNLPVDEKPTKDEYIKSLATSEERAKNKTLTDDFDAWEKKAFMTVKNYYRHLQEISGTKHAKHTQDLQSHIDKLAELPRIEYLLDTLIKNTGNFTAQIEFYKEYGKAVNRIEQCKYSVDA